MLENLVMELLKKAVSQKIYCLIKEKLNVIKRIDR